ncbi:MAG: AraC family transcriptional regulator [Bacteroidales bacterium]
MVPGPEIPVCDNNGGFTAQYVSVSNGFWHFHPEYEIMLNINTNGTRIVGDSIELFDSGDLVLIGGNIPHCWTYNKDSANASPGRGIMIHFNLSSIGEALLAQHEFQSVRRLLMDSERGIHFSVKDALLAESHIDNMVNTKGIEKMISFFKVLSIMCSSERKSLLCSETYKRVFDKRNNKKLNEIFAYVRGNYHRQINLEDASKVVDMSPFAFSKYFKKYSGEGFVEYLNKVRIDKARYLLRETEYQVHDIACQCGFPGISNFNKQFRREEGLSPRNYRVKFRKTP